MDIFEKCEKYTVAKDIQKLGIYPYFHALQSRQDVEVIMEGKRRIMLGSNNYLGLTTNPEVVEAGIKAYEQYGSGCSGSTTSGFVVMDPPIKASVTSFPARAFSTALLLCTSSLKRSLRSFCTRRMLSHFQLGFSQISE